MYNLTEFERYKLALSTTRNTTYQKKDYLSNVNESLNIPELADF